MKKATLAGLLLCTAVSAIAQTFRPFTELRAIRTERFDIIFPERSRRTAEQLADFADACYERVSALLDIRVRGRIPVTITSDTDLFNGYMNPVPYPHIVLNDAPMDIEWTSFRYPLESVFLHELVHAVSLSSRGPFFDFWYRIFGGWVTPTGLTAPPFMIEGVTVSFESLDGFGRANDPLVRERVAQAAADGAFLTPFQVSGVYDRPLDGNAHYEYGGLFSSYLQERWGMEAYARLWKEMGTRVPLSFVFQKHGFYRIFRDVYGVPFSEAWEDFSAAMTADGLEDNSGNAAVDGELQIGALVSGGGRLFFADKVELAVSAFDPATGKVSRVVGIDATLSDIDVSADGGLLLVASSRMEGQRARAVVREFDTASGSPTGRRWEGLQKPRYFRDGVVGVASDLHENRIVFRDGAGRETTLLPGGPRILYSAPAPLDGNRVVCIAAEDGVRRIVVRDVSAGTTRALRTDLADDAERFRYARDLRARDGKLYFAYTKAGGFYKLAVADGSGIIFGEREFSGGVFAPAEVGGELFYRGEFSSWDALLRYPEAGDRLGGTRAKIEWIEEAAAAIPPTALQTAAPAVRGERRYSPVPYLSPFKFWLPYPLIRSGDGTLRTDGAGILSYLSDPTDQNSVILAAGYDAAAGLGFADVTWLSTGLGTPVTLKASDAIEFESSGGLDYPYRAQRAELAVAFSRGLGSERRRLNLGVSVAAFRYAADPDDGSGAYSWQFGDPRYSLGGSAGLSTLRRPAWRLFGSGFRVDALGQLAQPSGDYRLDTIFKAAFEPVLPVSIGAYAVYDLAGTAADGSSLEFGDAPFEGMAEYASESPSDLTWLFGGNADLRLFSLEAQRSFSHLYFNRLFGILSWRGAAFPEEGGGRFVQSAVIKAGAVMSALPLAAVPVRFSPYFWAAWKLSNAGDGKEGNDYFAGFVFSVEW